MENGKPYFNSSMSLRFEANPDFYNAGPRSESSQTSKV